MHFEEKIAILHTERFSNELSKDKVSKTFITPVEGMMLINNLKYTKFKSILKYNKMDIIHLVNTESTPERLQHLEEVGSIGIANLREYISDETIITLREHSIILLSTLYKYINNGGTLEMLGVTSIEDADRLLEFYLADCGWLLESSCLYLDSREELSKTQINKKDKNKLVSLGMNIRRTVELVNNYDAGILEQDPTTFAIFSDINFKQLKLHIGLVKGSLLDNRKDSLLSTLANELDFEQFVLMERKVWETKYEPSVIVPVLLRYKYGKTVKEVAEITGYSASVISKKCSLFISSLV